MGMYLLGEKSLCCEGKGLPSGRQRRKSLLRSCCPGGRGAEAEFSLPVQHVTVLPFMVLGLERLSHLSEGLITNKRQGQGLSPVFPVLNGTN